MAPHLANPFLRRVPRIGAAAAIALLVPLLVPLLGACGGGGGPSPVPEDPPCAAGTGPPMTVSGRILYQRLVLSSGGLGPATETRPARFVDVRVRNTATGACYGEASADGSGDYVIVVLPPEGSTLEVLALSRTNQDPDHEIRVHDDTDPGTGVHTSVNCFRRASAPFAAAASAVVDLTVPYAPAGETARPSIGFGVLDILVTGWDGIRAAGATPPICHAYTRLGNNGAVGTTFYSIGTGAITVLAGAAGNLDNSDTDYFDDPVVLHEWGHFVEFQLAHSLNRGGSHQANEDLEPNFAWSEGQATGFGGLLRKDPVYRDSVGTAGQGAGSLNVESISGHTTTGIGSEYTVAELIWDLGDGIDGIASTDGDGLAISLPTLYQTLFAFSPTADAPSLGLYLERLVSGNAVTNGAVSTLLGSPEDQGVSWPLAGSDVWPLPLGLPDSASGTADSTVANPCRARDASVWYRLALPVQATVSLHLDVQPIAGFSGNLDLYLLDNAGGTIRVAATGGNADETISNVLLPAGSYLVRVEANCSVGNKADYLLTVN